MKLDAFNHIFPQSYYSKLTRLFPSLGDLDARMKGLPPLYDLDLRLKMMDEYGEGYAQINSLAAPPIESLAGPELSPELARIANDSMAELTAKYPDRFPGFVASLPLNNPDASVEEMERAIKQLKAYGVQFFTNVNGKPLDLPEFKPLFEKAAALGAPIWLHPARKSDSPDYKTETMSQYEIWWAIGWPYDTTAAMIRLVFGGYFDLWPDLKIITHHLGAMVPFFAGRLGPGYDVMGTRSPKELNYAGLLKTLKKRPLDYFKMFYADTALFGAESATRCGLEFFGPEHVLFASDFPFCPKKGEGSVVHHQEIIEKLPLGAEDKQKIFEGNLKRLLPK